MARKTPVLLRRAPLSGRVMVLTRYTHKDGILSAATDGKHDVTADYTALMLEELLDPDSPDIVAILDGVADGERLSDDERRQVRAFRERLKVAVERHNEGPHVAGQADASATT